MISPERFQALLDDFDLGRLFIEELGWDRAGLPPQTVTIEGITFTLTQLAQKRGVAVFRCSPDGEGGIPSRALMLKIEREAAKVAFEHLLLFADEDETAMTWFWVSRAPGSPARPRAHTWRKGQSGEALRQKLGQIVWSLEQEEAVTLTDVITGLKKAFDRERVSKTFYDRFKKQHGAFFGFVKGLSEAADREWYASLTLNRLMFVYFIQKKGFLDGDENYLVSRLKTVQNQAGKGKFHSFYRAFLRRLFHEGLGKPKAERTPDLTRLIGDIPYLNGGLFSLHELEESRPQLDVPDEAFETLFAFFDEWDWHLDTRPLRSGKEINPDVLGYIFEKFINQKQMGAYYTKEDITGYIGKYTIVPRLLEAVRLRCKTLFEGKSNQGEASLWDLLKADPDRYIYPAMKTGVIDGNGDLVPESILPDFVQKDMKDAAARMFDRRYNLGEAVFFTEQGKTGERGTLPTETWREYAERRARCLEVRQKLIDGGVKSADDLITLNLDICQFMLDAIANAEDPALPRAVWQAIAGRVPEKSRETFQSGITVLDPTCGSGAFLFAALNILEPFYEACLDRMEGFCEDAKKFGRKPDAGFVRILAEADRHPSRSYYVYKSIILNNLFGVDIMPEAVEICKLRLFLKLVAQVDRAQDLEPLPDIDFNIRAGNTLVGYATEKQFDEGGSLFNQELKKEIKLRLADLADCFDRFRQQQTVYGGAVSPADKQELRDRLRQLAEELDKCLGEDYKIVIDNESDFAAWRASHQPFHWFAEFYGVMREGGFDVVIGNPPYKDLKRGANYRLHNFSTLATKNLYPLVLERGFDLANDQGLLGWIVPVSSISTEGYSSLQNLMFCRSGHFSSYDDRPSRLFDGLEHIRLAIHLLKASIQKHPAWNVTKCHRWNAIERPQLFDCLSYEVIGKQYLPGCLPKVSSKLENALLDKIWRGGKKIESQTQDKSDHAIYYSRKVENFLQALDFIPEVFDGQGNLRSPSELKELVFSSALDAQAMFCVLNSSLFRWYVNVFSDCRHINKREIEGFRLDLAAATKANPSFWADGARSLSDSLKETSEYRDMKFQHDALRVQCIIPRKSKAIIDKIDQGLGRYYGFTDEELDFIVNYDIKYRMGGAKDD
jgi:hypothetical protein